ncbi:serine hydrolase [Streptomyces sp. NPDC006879]|uniref:serine hydrolase n=1 Tax=Streptomyces sp. NPDC006879 TaxID=3364767 RepID=UPI0036BFFCAD
MKHRRRNTALLLLSATLVVSAYVHALKGADARPPTSRPDPAAAPSGSPSDSTGAADPVQAARSALDEVGPRDGRYALAVEDLTTGHSVTHGSIEERFVSASIIKVDILAALLLRAQDHGTPLTTEQQRRAAAMICFSDNVAAQELWIEIGRRQGLDAANRRLGFSPAHAGQRGVWGLTRTTVLDQLTLLRRVFTEDSPLTAESRAYARSLMSNVFEEHDWGVSAASSPAGSFALKNGWLPRETTHLWVVNSIGMVEHGGHTLLVAVLTDRQATQEAGVSLIERTTTTAVEALTGGS